MHILCNWDMLLTQLHSTLSIVPQTHVVFRGTIYPCNHPVSLGSTAHLRICNKQLTLWVPGNPHRPPNLPSLDLSPRSQPRRSQSQTFSLHSTCSFSGRFHLRTGARCIRAGPPAVPVSESSTYFPGPRVLQPNPYGAPLPEPESESSDAPSVALQVEPWNLTEAARTAGPAGAGPGRRTTAGPGPGPGVL
jgi:hypothetical protein